MTDATFFARLRAQFEQARKVSEERGSGNVGPESAFENRSRSSDWRRRDRRYGGGSFRGGGDRDEDSDHGESNDSRDSSPDPKYKSHTDAPSPSRRHKSTDTSRQSKQQPPHRPRVAKGDVVHIGPAAEDSLKGKVLYDQQREDENALDDMQIEPAKKFARIRPEKEWAPNPTTMARILALGDAGDEENCFGCCYMRHDSSSPSYDRCLRLFRLIKQCITVAQHNILCIAIEFYYEKYVRGPTLLPGALPPGKSPLPPWRRGLISRHFRVHDPSFLFRRLNRLDQVNTMLNDLFDNSMYVWVRHKNGEPMRDANGNRLRRLDSESAELFTTLCRLEMALYGQNPKAVILSGSSEELTQDVRPLIRMEGKTFTTENAATLFSGITPMSLQGGAGEGGTVGAVRRM